VEADTRRLLWDELNRMTQSVAETYRLKAEVTLLNGAPPIVNPSGPTAWARAAVANVLGGDALKPLGFLNMGGEDFAFYLERVPGCFLRIGAREQGGETIPAHSPKFFAAEESILVGAAVLAECARVASREDSLVQS
ncbi:MAG: M20/M25/M40 family metallo-hydrolase, partial [Candidatus Hydrogenedentota bacterium]